MYSTEIKLLWLPSISSDLKIAPQKVASREIAPNIFRPGLGLGFGLGLGLRQSPGGAIFQGTIFLVPPISAWLRFVIILSALLLSFCGSSAFLRVCIEFCAYRYTFYIDKKAVLKFLEKLKEKHAWENPIFIKLQAWNYTKKTPPQVFSCELSTPANGWLSE